MKNSPTSSTFVYLGINEGAVLFTDIRRSEYGYRSLSAYLCSHIVAMHFLFLSAAPAGRNSSFHLGVIKKAK